MFQQSVKNTESIKNFAWIQIFNLQTTLGTSAAAKTLEISHIYLFRALLIIPIFGKEWNPKQFDDKSY